MTPWRKEQKKSYPVFIENKYSTDFLLVSYWFFFFFLFFMLWSLMIYLLTSWFRKTGAISSLEHQKKFSFLAA